MVALLCFGASVLAESPDIDDFILLLLGGSLNPSSFDSSLCAVGPAVSVLDWRWVVVGGW